MVRYPTLIPACCLLIGLLLAAFSVPVSAQVFRCIDANGNPAFLQRPCDSEQMRERNAPADTEEGGGMDNTGFCPAPDLESLKLAINSAFTRRDLNALSGLYHWPSVGRGGAGPILGWLGTLLDHRLLGIDLRFRARHRITAHGITREVGNDEEDATGLRLILGTEPPGPANSAELALVRYAGCLWISESPSPVVER
ncbi:MAG: DUF4124 domain-containing protein [Lysobacteraceae bacterium]